MRKIIMLNGPPYSGKDTAGRFLATQYGSVGPYYARCFKFSAPLKEAARAFFSLTDKDIEFFSQREHKDEPHEIFGGMSYREVQITLSEKWAKMYIGDDAFGKMMLNQIEASPARMAIITDSGFESEAWPLIKEYGIKNCLNIHIQREGTTFEGDSRSYWEVPGMTTVDLYNVMSLDMFEKQVVRTVEKWLNEGRK